MHIWNPLIVYFQQIIDYLKHFIGVADSILTYAEEFSRKRIIKKMP